MEITDADRTIAVVLSKDVMFERTDHISVPGECDSGCRRNIPGRAAALRTRVTAVLQGVDSSTYSGSALSNMPVSIADRTATSSADYYVFDTSRYRTRRVTFPRGSVVANADLPIHVYSRVDDTAEPDEYFEIGLVAPDGFTVVPATVKIVDDDVQVDLDIVPYQVLEDAGESQNVVLQARMRMGVWRGSSLLGSMTTIDGMSVDHTVDSDSRRNYLNSTEYSYTSWSGLPLTIGAHEFDSCPDPDDTISCSRATLMGLRIVDDTVVEGPEYLRVSGQPSAAGVTRYGYGYILTDTDVVSYLEVIDDDANITLSVTPGQVAEGAAGHRVMVTAEFAGDSSVLTEDTLVGVWVGSGTATIGASNDFTTDLGSDDEPNELTVVIPAGELSGSNLFTLTARDDNTMETGGETVSLSIASVWGPFDIDDITPTATTLDIVDPSGSSITLSLTDTAQTPAALSAVGEDGGAQTVRIVATAGTAPSSDLDVAVSIGGGSATAGADYTVSSSSVTVTIPANTTSGTVDVMVTPVSDTVTEAHEKIFISGEAAGYIVSAAGLTITDADRDIRVVVENPMTREIGNPRSCNEATANLYYDARDVSVRLEGETSTYPDNIGDPVDGGIQLIVSDGTATGGTDYYPLGQQVRAGQWEISWFPAILPGEVSVPDYWLEDLEMPFICNDRIAEGNETIDIYFGWCSGWVYRDPGDGYSGG